MKRINMSTILLFTKKSADKNIDFVLELNENTDGNSVKKIRKIGRFEKSGTKADDYFAIQNKLDYPKKIGLISGTGDRRDEDIRELGTLSAQYFDEIIIRCDKNLRGRTAEEIIHLLKEGIEMQNASIPTMVIENEEEALEYIYAHPQQGALYTIMCDVVTGALDKIKELKDRENNG